MSESRLDGGLGVGECDGDPGGVRQCGGESVDGSSLSEFGISSSQLHARSSSEYGSGKGKSGSSSISDSSSESGSLPSIILAT